MSVYLSVYLFVRLSVSVCLFVSQLSFSLSKPFFLPLLSPGALKLAIIVECFSNCAKTTAPSLDSFRQWCSYLSNLSVCFFVHLSASVFICLFVSQLSFSLPQTLVAPTTFSLCQRADTFEPSNLPS
jgi:hypothetical protein